MTRDSKNSHRYALLLACSLVGLPACESPTDDPATEDDGSGDDTGSVGEAEVEIFTWWQNASESAALEALSSTFSRQHPNVAIRTVTFDGQSEAAMVDLSQRWMDGEVVDVLQVLPRDLDLFRQFDADGQAPRNVLRNLDDLMVSSGAADQIPATILELVQDQGSTWSVPVGLHRHNGMFYNKSLLADVGATAPRSLAEFASLCETVETYNADRSADDRIDTMANSLQGWTLDIVFNSIIAGGANEVTPGSGADYMHRFLSGLQSIDDPEFLAATHALNTIFKCSNQPAAVTGRACVGGDRAGDYCSSDSDCGAGTCPEMTCSAGDDAGKACTNDDDCSGGSCDDNYHDEWDFGWNHAADLVRHEKAILFIHGDWAKGEFDAVGFADYDVVPAFGSDGMFLFNMDTLATFADAPNPVNAENYIRTVLSPEGQAEFSIRKGSTPARRDVPLDGFNAVARKTVEEYRDASFIQDAETLAPWGLAIGNPLRDFWRARARDGFASSGARYDADVETFLDSARQAYEELRLAKGTH